MVYKMSIKNRYFLVIVSVFLITIITIRSMSLKKETVIDTLQSMSLQISELISYGTGPVLESRNPTEAEILAYGEGHCGMYAYLFAKRLSMQGIKSRTVDIRRYDGGAHSVVEVNLSGKVYTFDPTLGIYYQAGAEELLDNPDFESLKTGEPVRLPEYASAVFWSGVRQLVYYSDVRDSYDYDLLKDGASAIYSNCLPAGMADEIAAVSQEGEEPFIQIEFDGPRPFYRVKFYWSALPEVPLTVPIETAGADGALQTVYEGEAEAGNVCFSYTFPSEITAQSIRISFPDTAPEIAQLQIFE